MINKAKLKILLSSTTYFNLMIRTVGTIYSLFAFLSILPGLHSLVTVRVGAHELSVTSLRSLSSRCFLPSVSQSLHVVPLSYLQPIHKYKLFGKKELIMCLIYGYNDIKTCKMYQKPFWSAIYQVIKHNYMREE